MNFCFLSLTPCPRSSPDRSLISTSISLLRTHKLILKVENIHPLAPSKQVQEVVSHERLPMSGWSAPVSVCHHKIFYFFEGSETSDLPARFFFLPCHRCHRRLWSPRRKLTNTICIWASQCGICNLSALQKDLLGVKGIVKIGNSSANPNDTFAKDWNRRVLEAAEWVLLKHTKKPERNPPPPKKAKTKNPRTIDDAIFIYMHLLWQFALHQKFTRIFVRSLHGLKY